jgi:gamma-glutamyltranspeptidase/glutathione hydrolase
MPHRKFLTGLLAALAALALCTSACSPYHSDAPPSGSASAPGPPLVEGMVVTANPHATNTGEAILRAGGTAVDAAIAIEAMLSLVEPQSSGLGGGGFMMYYHAEDRELTVYEGRETAPAGAHSDMFLTPEGKTLGYLEGKNSGLSIGVPGMVAMLSMAHAEHGALPWGDLFGAATRLAIEGFDVSPRLRSFLLRYDGRMVPRTEDEGPLDALHYFYQDNGEPRSKLQNPDYAAALEAIGEDPENFYRGKLAREIVAAAAKTPRAGSLSLDDLAAYRARKSEALCMDYRDLQVCGPPPPSSWVAIAMTLGLLEAAPFPSADRLQDWATFTEAQRLAYADRDFFVADTDFVDVPIAGMLSKHYLRERAQLIDADVAAPKVKAGNPWDYQGVVNAKLPGSDTTIDYAGTTHFVVADRWGNVVSMTASVESFFGSSRMAGGMFLNNQLTDFAKQPRDADGVLAANHAAPGKRPRSSMSPTLVLDQSGAFRMATGSPGGNSIIAYTLKTLVGVLDWKMSPQEAVNLPNIVARGDTVRIESSRASPALIAAMREHGFKVKESAGETSGLSVVLRHPDGKLQGGVDPRREGTIARIGIADPLEPLATRNP